jgi:hypothetical protein
MTGHRRFPYGESLSADEPAWQSCQTAGKRRVRHRFTVLNSSFRAAFAAFKTAHTSRLRSPAHGEPLDSEKSPLYPIVTQKPSSTAKVQDFLFRHSFGKNLKNGRPSQTTGRFKH